MRNVLFVLVYLLALTGCRRNPPAAAQRQALENRVMEVHDAAMANMDQLLHWRRQLKARRDSLQSSQVDTRPLNLLDQHLAGLARADSAMMAWMHGYKSPDKSMPQDSALHYLQVQLERMEGVKKNIDSSLAAAQHIYKAYEPKK